LKTILGELSSLYDRHIKLEEAEIFPLAKSLLSEVEERAIGREMAQRRGLVIEERSTIIAGTKPT
jgi:hemerythrin-like domain-containing protein